MSMHDLKELERLSEQVLPRCRHPVRSLLLIGSWAEGYANASSDIDLIGVVAEVDRHFRTEEQGFHLDDRPVSVLYISERMLRRRLKRLDSLYRAGGHLTDGIATRMADAVVLFDPEGIGRALVLEARRYSPAPATIREMIRIAFGFLNDALGSRSAADYPTAVLMARAGASVAVDCFLLAQGERNLRMKWHLRRLAKRGATTVLGQYLKILGLDALTADQASSIIRQTEQLLCSVLQIPALDRFNESPLLARLL